MTFISFNPGTMADLIANMRDLGDSVDIVRQKIRDTSSINFDPVPGVEESTDPAWAAWNLDSTGPVRRGSSRAGRVSQCPP